MTGSKHRAGFLTLCTSARTEFMDGHREEASCTGKLGSRNPCRSRREAGADKGWRGEDRASAGPRSL